MASIGDIVYNGNWIQYPLNHRTFVQLVILRSQTAVYFTGFKLFRCTLETFGNVSYFDSLKKVNK